MFLYIEIHQQPACIYETVLSKSENTQFRPFSISQFYLHKSVLPNSCFSLTEYFEEYQLTLTDAVAIPFDMRFFPVFRALGPKNPGR